MPPIYVGSKELKDLQVGGTSVKEVYVGSTKVWPSWGALEPSSISTGYVSLRVPAIPTAGKCGILIVQTVTAETTGIPSGYAKFGVLITSFAFFAFYYKLLSAGDSNASLNVGSSGGTVESVSYIVVNSPTPPVSLTGSVVATPGQGTYNWSHPTSPTGKSVNGIMGQNFFGTTPPTHTLGGASGPVQVTSTFANGTLGGGLRCSAAAYSAAGVATGQSVNTTPGAQRICGYRIDF